MSAVEGPEFLVHEEGDTVAIATRDLSPGSVQGAYLKGPASITVELADIVPLGHKFALQGIADGDEVIEYGVCIALASKNVGAGQHVHVHNVRSVRWQNSVVS